MNGSAMRSHYRQRGRVPWWAAAALAAIFTAILVAPVSALGDSCPNAQFREGASAQLPECRAYEKVSPGDKNGFEIGETPGLTQAATGGNAISYGSIGAFGDSAAGPPWTQYLARRGASGWTTVGTTPTLAGGLFNSSFFPKYAGFSDDLSRAVLTSPGPALAAGAPEVGQSLYYGDPATRSFELVGAGESKNLEAGPVFAAASADFRHILFESPQILTPNAASGFTNLYVWTEGSVEFVGVLPNGQAAKGSRAGSGGAGQYGNPYTNTTLSSDGDTVFFTNTESGRLYVRKGISTASPSTAWVSEPQRPVAGPDPNGPKPATFVQAAPDGSYVLFRSGEKLTEDATTGPESLGSDLYLYDVASGQLEDISVDTNPADENGAEVGAGSTVGFSGVVGISNDGRRVYFVAKGALAPGATPGKGGLYLWEREGSGGNTTFITETIDWSSYAGVASGFEVGKFSRINSDGSVAYFSGDSNAYRYELGASAPECISCTAYRPAGGGVRLAPLTQPLSNQVPNTYQARSMIDGGDRIFFNSTRQLVPADTNDVADVYEWSQGEIHLISTGQSTSPSWFMDAGADGKDLFIVTRSQLVGTDQDELVDLYDARVAGGFAEEVPLAPCEGAACRSGTTAATSSPSIATAAFSGPGDRPVLRQRARCRKPAKGRKANASKETTKKRCLRARKRGPHRKHRQAKGPARKALDHSRQGGDK